MTRLNFSVSGWTVSLDDKTLAYVNLACMAGANREGEGEKGESGEKGREGPFPSLPNPPRFFSSSLSPIPFGSLLRRLE